MDAPTAAAPAIYRPRTGKQWYLALASWAFVFVAALAVAPFLRGTAALGRHAVFGALGGVFFGLAAVILTANAILRLPVVTATDTDIRMRSIFGERRARWQDLRPFKITEVRASAFRTIRTARAEPAPCAGVGRVKRFSLPDSFDRPLDQIVGELNARRAAALGSAAAVEAADPFVAPVRRRATAWASAAILALLGIVFTVEAALSSGATFKVSDLLAMGASNRVLVAEGEWWRLVTASALHGGFAHIFLNGIALLMAGFILERLVGRAWFVAIYCVSALGGALLSIALNPPSTTSVGASGAIMGLFAATVVCALRLPAGQRISVLVSSLRILVPALLPRSSSGGMIVDYGAHFGGAVFGGTMALLLLWVWPKDAYFPPFRPVAMAIAAAWGLLTAASFAAVAAHYGAYHVEFIPAQLLPRSEPEIVNRGPDLAARYPGDPRAHLFKAIALMERNDFTAAEAEFRTAATGFARFESFFGRRLQYTAAAGVAYSLAQEKRPADAKAAASEVCHAAPSDRPAPRIMALLEQNRLCE